MQVRVRWSVLVVCALLTACAPPDMGPRPSGTLEPSITESSPEAPKPPPNDACKLLSSEEREDLVRMSMDAEVPVRPFEGTEECVWTHSLNERARSAIRVVALEGFTWSQVARPQVTRAMARPTVSRALARKLEQALDDLSNRPRELTDERICEIYLLTTEAYGMQRAEEMVFYGYIGAIPAVYAASCEDGIILLAGFGEYGLRASIAANHAVLRLVESANGRVSEVIEGAEAGDDTDEDAGDTDESPGPEPSAEDEADSEEEDS